MATITEAERYLAELKYAMDYYVARCKYDAAKRMMEIMKR